ncbi:PHD finger protein 3 [Dinochytrium kinnereticum]|nr:PHD finger protein 3 [Dinochytrium kinnereticum]
MRGTKTAAGAAGAADGMTSLDSGVGLAGVGVGLDINMWGTAFEASPPQLASSHSAGLVHEVLSGDEETFDDDEDDEEEEDEVCAAAEEAGMDVKAAQDDDDVESVDQEPLEYCDDGLFIPILSVSDEDDEKDFAGNESIAEPANSETEYHPVSSSDAESSGENESCSRSPSSKLESRGSADSSALFDGPGVKKKVVRLRKQPYNEKGERVYCVCRKIDDGTLMIQCDSCWDWYHGPCIDMTEQVAHNITSYECDECVELRKEQDAQMAKTLGSVHRRAYDSGHVGGHTPIRHHSFVDQKESDSKYDKIRAAVRKAFTETFTAMFSDLKLQPAVSPTESNKTSTDKIDPRRFAENVEDELFEFLSEPSLVGNRRTAGEKYKSKFRTLQFNLKDKKNKSLRKKIVSGGIGAETLVRLEAEDLANEEIKAKAEAIRLEGIRNAIKPKDVVTSSVFKKTHKGEVEISVADASREPATPTKPGGKLSVVYAEPAEVGLARRPEKPRRDSPPAVDKSFHSLDDLLAKMVGDGRPTKRSPDVSETREDGRDPKKTRYYGRKPHEVDLQMRDKETTRVGTRDTADFTSWEDMEGRDMTRSGDEVEYSYRPSAMDLDASHPPASARETTAHIWSGIVRMAGVGMFNGKCQQIAGRDIGDSKLWEDVLPPNITVEGRIDTKAVKNYVGQLGISLTKEVVAVEFRPDDQVDGDSLVKTFEGFKILFDYFYEKKRYAVVGQNYISVKDMYLVPVKAGEPLPEMITVLKKCTVGIESRPHDSIFGVIILDKSFFAKPRSKTEPSVSAQKRDAWPAQEARKKYDTTSCSRGGPRRTHLTNDAHEWLSIKLPTYNRATRSKYPGVPSRAIKPPIGQHTVISDVGRSDPCTASAATTATYSAAGVRVRASKQHPEYSRAAPELEPVAFNEHGQFLSKFSFSLREEMKMLKGNVVAVHHV